MVSKLTKEDLQKLPQEKRTAFLKMLQDFVVTVNELLDDEFIGERERINQIVDSEFHRELDYLREKGYDETIELISKVTGKSVDEIHELDDISFYEEIRKFVNQEIIAQVEMLDNIIPNKYIIPNNKLANTLTKDGVELDMEFDLVMNGKREVITKVSLNYEDENITIYDEGKKFTPYDRSVHNAVCSLLEAGNTNFTPERVYRCINGLDDSQYVSPQAVGAITKSLDKARRTYVKIDCSQEAALYKNSENFKLEIEDYLLPAKKIKLISGKNEVTGYKLNSKPILYDYAQMTKQVISVPSKLLNTKDVIKSTPEVIVIREYLIRRIEEMKSPRNSLGNKILLSKIYEEIGQPEPTKQKAGKIKNALEKLLGKFQKEKYIKGFDFYKEGRTFKGIEIFY